MTAVSVSRQRLAAIPGGIAILEVPRAVYKISRVGEEFLPAADGKVVKVPKDWGLLPPCDAALTWRAKAAGDHWVVREKKGRKMFARGVWAPAATIEQIKAELAAERSTETFAKRKAADAKRREKTQTVYAADFTSAVVSCLAFHPAHAELAQRLAQAVAAHATPIGSGTVARTKRIPIERQASSAVIAWMRHQTTAYDTMKIPRVKSQRFKVRRLLALQSRELLARYRRGDASVDDCPLVKALSSDLAAPAAHQASESSRYY